MINKIISGGQTGADQAALDVAIRLGIPHGGWIPKGRRTEAGFLPTKYQLQVMPTASYPLRTEQNVIDSDGTLIFSHGKVTGGSALTEKNADKHNRPSLHVDLDIMTELESALKIATWIMKNQIDVLNVAGSRASKDALIYQAVTDVLESAIHLVKDIPEKYADTDITDEILAAMPLRDKSSIANMETDQIDILQQVFEMYIRSKIDATDDDFNEIMVQMWDRLKETHRLRSME